MHDRRASPVVLLLALVVAVPSCDVAVTVGYNDAAASVGPDNCPSDAAMHACTSQTCVLTELSVAQMGKETVAVDAEFVYFLRETNVLTRMTKDGGAIVDLAAVAPSLERVTIDDEDVYWTQYDGNILRVPKAGGPTATVASIFGQPVSIAAHADDLYIALPESGEVVKLAKSTGAEVRLPGQNRPVDLGLDGEHVYWVNHGTAGAADGELVRAPLGDLAAAEVIRSDLQEPLAIGVARDAVVWATYDTVFRLPREGGEPQGFEAPFGEPKGVTEFDGILYIAGQTGFFRVRVADGDAMLLDQRGFTGLALGCDGVYLVGWYEPLLLRYSR